METVDGWILTFALNALWQVPAVVLAGLLGDRLLRQAPARQRHALWLAVLAACVLLPAASIARGDRLSVPSRPEASPSEISGEAGAAAEQFGWLPVGESRLAPFPPAAAAAIVLLYGLSLLFHGVRLGRAWLQADRLVRRAHALEIPAARAPVVSRCRAAIGLRGLEILGSPEIAGPVTVGARRPVILLPSGFLASASPEETAAALGHEMAHVRRRDYAVNLLCEVVLLPIAFHPAARLVRRRLAESREMACDEAALETLIEPRAYARSLLSLAACAAGLPRPSTTLGVLDAHTLEVRMKRILDVGPRIGARRARASLGAALLLLGGIAAAASAFAVQAVAKESPTGGLGPFVGTWSGDWPPNEKDKGEERKRALDLEIRPDGQILATWYRYKKTPDGPTLVDKETWPAKDFEISGRTLILKVRVEDFKFRDNPPAPAEFVESLELRGRDEAVFKILSNSYFAAASKRGEPVPPPPPPISMKRVS